MGKRSIRATKGAQLSRDVQCEGRCRLTRQEPWVSPDDTGLSPQAILCSKSSEWKEETRAPGSTKVACRTSADESRWPWSGCVRERREAASQGI